MSEVEALQQALAAEHAAIWAYGVVGAYALTSRRAEIADAQQEHRVRRDEVETLLTEREATPTPGLATYTLPSPVSDPVTGLTVAATVEDGVGAAWRYVLGRTDDPTLRSYAVQALTATALQAVRWRQVLGGTTPVTRPLPGFG